MMCKMIALFILYLCYAPVKTNNIGDLLGEIENVKKELESVRNELKLDAQYNNDDDVENLKDHASEGNGVIEGNAGKPSEKLMDIEEKTKMSDSNDDDDDVGEREKRRYTNNWSCDLKMGQDGIGRDEFEVTKTVKHNKGLNFVTGCIEECKLRMKSDEKLRINGMTYEPKAKRCWCEIGMKKTKKTTKYETCFFSEALCAGEDNCCTYSNKCKKGDGKCQWNNQCEGNLICGRENCAWKNALGGHDDCCMEKPTMAARKKGDHGCTLHSQCQQYEGDCDWHEDCKGNLLCGQDNCEWGNGDDCCMERPKTGDLVCHGVDNSVCANGRCGLDGNGNTRCKQEGSGNCYFDWQCGKGLGCYRYGCMWRDGKCCFRNNRMRPKQGMEGVKHGLINLFTGKRRK